MSEKKEWKFCFNCGAAIENTARFCPHCGARQPDISEGGSSSSSLHPANVPSPRTDVAQYSRKSPFLAAFLSFLLCGLGQVYNGQAAKGLFMFVVAIALSLFISPFLGTLILIYSIIDAYTTAVQLNSSSPPYHRS